MKTIILTGPEGAGVSVHVEYLAVALRRLGLRAKSWTAPFPRRPEVKGPELVRLYSQAWKEAEIVADYLVVNRGPWAPIIHARTLRWKEKDTGLKEAVLELKNWPDSLCLFLDAGNSVLDRRLKNMGLLNPEFTNGWDRFEWRTVRMLEGWETIRTETPTHETHKGILESALRWIGNG